MKDVRPRVVSCIAPKRCLSNTAGVFRATPSGYEAVMARSLWTDRMSFRLVSVKELRCELVEKTQKKGSRSRKRASKAS